MSGTLMPAAQREIEAHLEACAECRDEVGAMRDISKLFGAFRPPEAIQPPPGFTARVVGRLAAQQAVSFWSVFSLDPIFGRRVAFAALVLLAVLGSLLVTRETRFAAAPPTADMVWVEDAPRDSDEMLVRLTAYEP